jgi:hypothetical protein
MNKRPEELTLTFEKGGTFKARLLWEKAPRTCEAIVNVTPIAVSEVRWGEIIGDECYFTTGISLDVMENTVYPIPGTISFNPDPKWKAFIVYYGDNLKLTKTFNQFAQVETDLDGLKRVGRRIERDGPEGVKIPSSS